jgi:hypothetical protein
MSFIFKYLLISILTLLYLHAKDIEKDSNYLEKKSPAAINFWASAEPNFNSEENYKKLTSAYDRARTNKAYNDSILAVYAFVTQCPEDLYSVDLLKHVAIFFPTWESDVNVCLFRKIVDIPSHPKIYEAHMVLYFYGDDKDKSFSIWNFGIIAGDKKHPRQKCAAEFIREIRRNQHTGKKKMY